MNIDIIQKIQPIDFHWEMENPFLFCAHHKDAYPPGNKNQGVDAALLKGRNIGSDFTIKDGFRMYHGLEVPGFPVHPHRGFETVTVVTQGYVDHFDSMGAQGRYGQGDVQWMTAGKGCQHAEMFPLVYENKPNPLNLLQIWLNLPKKNKFVEPAYKMLWHEDIPIVEQTQNGNKKTAVTVIAGVWAGKEAPPPTPDSWAADPKNHVGIFLIRMQAGAALTIPATSPTANRNLYNYQGRPFSIADKEIAGKNRVKLAPDRDVTIDNGSVESFFILLQAEPIQETIIKHGPFVMNSEQEIKDAYADYHRTRFGGWPFEREIPVNDRNSRRYARFADGTEEVRRN